MEQLELIELLAMLVRVYEVRRREPADAVAQALVRAVPALLGVTLGDGGLSSWQGGAPLPPARVAAYVLEKLDAVHLGHQHVEQNEVRRRRVGQRGKRLDAVGGADDANDADTDATSVLVASAGDMVVVMLIGFAT